MESTSVVSTGAAAGLDAVLLVGTLAPQFCTCLRVSLLGASSDGASPKGVSSKGLVSWTGGCGLCTGGGTGPVGCVFGDLMEFLTSSVSHSSCSPAKAYRVAADGKIRHRI